MPGPSGFTFEARKSGEVLIRHHGQVAGLLRGAKAQRFLIDVDAGDPQELMARITGNYKHGNERDRSSHPRRG